MADYAWPVAPINSVYLLTLHMSWCSQKLMNTFYYNLYANPLANTVVGIYDLIDNDISAANKLLADHAACRDTNCNLTQTTVQMVWPQRFVSKAYVKNIPGTIVGANDTPNLHATISRRAVGGTRMDTGHVHIPCPIDTTVFLDGLFTAAYKTKLTTLAVEMDTDLGAVGIYQLAPCLFNRNNQPTTRIIGTTAPKDEVRVSRRRTVGLGI